MTLPGIDVSQYQTTTPQLRGFAFLFARATYNLTPDTHYAEHTAAAVAAGIVRGAYHFGTGASTPQAQAAAFLANAHDAQILALDLEGDPSPMTGSQAALFLQTVKATDPLHRKVGLYHSLSGYPTGIGQDFNWVAAWQATPPGIPWAFWQYTSSGSVPGYAGHVDLDSFNGTQAQLNAMAGIVPPKPVAWTLHIAAGTRIVMLANLATRGCITGYTDRPWAGNASSAPCREPKLTPGCAHGSARIAYVTRGAFSGKWVLLAGGVTATPNA